MTRLTVNLEGDTQVIVRRNFRHAPERVWAAHVDPQLIRQWLLGPDGWTMSDCQFEPRPGGKIRFAWEPAGGGPGGFHLTGELVEVEAPHRMVHVERMHLPDPTPDNRVETLFQPTPDGGTLMVMTMNVADAATRQAMLDTGMTDGMEASYQRLDAMA